MLSEIFTARPQPLSLRCRWVNYSCPIAIIMSPLTRMTQERGNRLIKTGLADSLAFGRPYIANPDLPMRFLRGAELNEVNWPRVYASGPKGYTDYPPLIESLSHQEWQ